MMVLQKHFKGRNFMLKKSAIAFFIVIGLFFIGTKLSATSATSNIQEVNDLASIDSIDNGYIYFGRPTCPYCEIFYPNLDKSAIDNNVSVTYLNTDEVVSEEDLNRIIDIYNLEYVPYLVKIKNGEIEDAFDNTYIKNDEKTLENLSMFFR
ncbi:MAG: thioredoxin family protein [Bacteroidales bacterium]